MTQELVSQQSNVARYIPFHGLAQIGDEAEQPIPAHVTLVHCTGRPAMRQVIDTKTGEVKRKKEYYAGLFCDIGVDPELDKAMRLIKAEKLTISHQNGPEDHWIFPAETEVFLVAKGVQTFDAMKRTKERRGLAYGERDGVSYLYFQVLVKALLEVGYAKPFVIALKSTQTGDGLNIFRAQSRVIRYAHDYLQGLGQDMALPWWSYSINLMAAVEPSTRGQGQKTSDIFPLVATLPGTLNPDYLQAHECPVEHIDLLRGLAGESVAWSTDLVARITEESVRKSQVLTENDPFSEE